MKSSCYPIAETSLISDSTVESSPRSPGIALPDPETTPFSTNRDRLMEKDNGIHVYEKAVKPVQVDTATNGVPAPSNADGVSGDHAANGTNGVKISSSPIAHLGNTSLPPAAIEVGLESPRNMYSNRHAITDLRFHKTSL